jgi:hypothetical protein
MICVVAGVEIGKQQTQIQERSEMTRQTNPKLKSFLTGVLFVIGAACSAFAQSAPKFKVGDVAECDTSGAHQYWQKCTIISFQKNDMYNGYGQDSGYFYRVRLERSADVPEGFLVKAEDMRPVAVAKQMPKPTRIETPQAPQETKQTGNNRNGDGNENTVLSSIKTPEGKICNLLTAPTTEGVASAELFKAVIKAQYDKQNRRGQDGAVCLEFTSFQVGASQQWQPANDPRRVGTERLGTKPKTIYPVKTSFRVISDYNTVWETTEWTGAVFTCFKDESFGNWKCRGEQGFDWQYKSKRIPKQ